MCVKGNNGVMTQLQNKMNGAAPAPKMPGLFQKLALKANFGGARQPAQPAQPTRSTFNPMGY